MKKHHEESKAPAPLELPTLELDQLDEIHGGLQWPLWTYKVGNAIAGWDPASVAANFIM